jgi:AraC family transcriptional regulator, regulatory protein of adaptative response / DNA-3-methyladenine glycosylase II
MDDEQCYRAVLSRDARFDGWFVIAVHTTKIYCRPSCPATTPKRQNVSFFATSATAQQRGFRACKRCRPDASPGSPEWNIRADVVGRAMRLIADGVVDRDGVPGLSRRLGYSERHLNRLLTEELGAGPIAIARAQRAQTARLLIETTSMSMTDAAFAAGFSSIRQFNDTVREVFASTPTELRTARQRRDRRHQEPSGFGGGSISLRLPVRQPFDAAGVLAFLGTRAVPGVESWDGRHYRRALRLPRGSGIVCLREQEGAVACTLWLASVSDLQAAVHRCRRLLDLDADPIAIDRQLGSHPALAALVAARPGLRSPGAVDGPELLVRAILGQQVSVAGARTVAGRLAAQIGDQVRDIGGGPCDDGPLDDEPDGDGHSVRLQFPCAAAIAAMSPDDLPMPGARARSLIGACTAIADGSIVIDPGADRAQLTSALERLPGIGPWTTQYVAMRALGEPDVFMPTDLGVRHALVALGLDGSPAAADRLAQEWSPWRSYALHHLWRNLSPSPKPPQNPPPEPKGSAVANKKGKMSSC